MKHNLVRLAREIAVRFRFLFLMIGCVPACGAPVIAPSFAGAFLDVSPAGPFVLPTFDGNEALVDAWGLAGDLDGDGHDEVLLAVNLHDPQGTTTATLRAYRFAGEALVPADLPSLPAMAHPQGLVDIDGDGFLDLVSGDSGGEVAWGMGKAVFSPVTPLGPQSSAFQFDPTYGFSLADLDDDGWLDALVGNNACQGNGKGVHVLLADGIRHYQSRDEIVSTTNPGNPQALGVLWLEGGNRAIAAWGAGCNDKPDANDVLGRRVDAQGNATFTALDLDPGTDLSQGAPMGSVTGDLDGDGLLDHLVALNPNLTLLLGRADGSYADRSGGTGMQKLDSTGSWPLIPWGLALIDVDGDGRLDVLAAHGNDANSWTNRHYFVGPQHVTVHWNGGGLRFAEASAALHVDVPGQYKALVLADIDGDGAPDFIAGGDQQNSRVFVNRVAPAGTSLALRLAGTTSNPLGLGARVDVDVGDGSPVRHLIAGGSVSPYAFAEPLVFAGLGKAAAAARVTITWPSGVTQVIQNVAGGSVHRVAEPPSIVLSPAGRHAPADGRSTVAVVVTPPWPEPVVVLVSGRPAPVAVGPDGKVTATLVAPTQPGVDRVDVRVGDRELGVHPRVWWD